MDRRALAAAISLAWSVAVTGCSSERAGTDDISGSDSRGAGTAAGAGSSTSSGGGDGCTSNGNACGLVCDADLGCVQCAQDADCPSSNAFCTYGHCRACRTADDCDDGKACFPGDGTCKKACESNADCKSDEEPICDVQDGLGCVGCVDDGDCDATRPRCDPERRRCVACTRDAECNFDAPFCDLYAGNCVGCRVDDDCEGGVCKGDQVCHLLCEGDLDCSDPEKPHCRTEDGVCLACVSDSECEGTTPICNDASGECIECRAETDCPTQRPACSGGQCVECLLDSQCNQDLPRCSNATCVECLTGADCSFGATCESNHCVG